MSQSNHFSLGVRVANFSDLDLTAGHVLGFGPADVDAIVTIIRQHADLPYVFVVAPDQAERVRGVLAALKAVHSPCYPYAVFTTAPIRPALESADIDILALDSSDPETVHQRVDDYAAARFRFNRDRLHVGSAAALPAEVEVVVVGGGITGLYAADRLQRRGIAFCVLEKEDRIGGIWSMYANATSRVNTSEAAYRLIGDKPRSNRDHSATREILEDLTGLAKPLAERIFLESEVTRIDKQDSGYRVGVRRGGQAAELRCKGVILAINDRIGAPREIRWKDQELFQGEIVAGMSDKALDTNWRDKAVVVVGMGAFAVENARTALEGGARQVTVIGRRHGTVCPKIIDYLNFATPYDEAFRHDKKSNIRNMMYWKKLYELSGATQPECWMGKIKHTGHTISVSDIWFIGHFLKKIRTVTGTISRLRAGGVVVDDGQQIEADIVVNCVGFERNGSVARKLCGYDTTTTINYVDKDFMYLADAFIDDDAFNSFFGSSVLEMAKFYMEVYITCFDAARYDELVRTEGIAQIPIDDRKWSHYIAGATALIRNHPDLYRIAKRQVDRRTADFLEKHDLAAYIAENQREWFDTHAMLAGKPMAEADCLPYVFDRLLA